MDGRNVLKVLTDMRLAQNGGTLSVGGFSMIPLLVAGDTVRLQTLPPEQYKIGDILVCVDENARLVVHRVIRIRKEDGERIYYTKGDNAVACERITEKYCIGKVVEVTNRNGKQITLKRPGLRERRIVRLSRKVNRLYQETRDPNYAYASVWNRKIYDTAPDYLKSYVYDAQNYMIQKAKEYILGIPPEQGETPGGFVFTQDFYAMLVNHRVLNVLYPYVIGHSGRFGKFLKLSKAKNLTASGKMQEWALKIAAAFETTGIEYVLYKGIAAASFAYGDPFLRECDDIDFLIQRKDVPAAHQILYDLGFYNHDARGEFRTDAPEEEFFSHITPYVFPGHGVTVELHTALYMNEGHTAEILARRQRLALQNGSLFVLADTDLYVCQLYITAVDDFGCSNMSYDMDPNIFLKLKFRNYIDVLLLTWRFRDIPAEELLETARRYDIHFYLYLALYYTGKIFERNNTGIYSGMSAFLEPIYRFQTVLREYEDLDDALYRLPIDAHSCMLSPFKMKMNGTALRKLRDAFYLSAAWRNKQEALQSSETSFLEINRHTSAMFQIAYVTEKIALIGNNLEFCFEIDRSQAAEEFLIAISVLRDKKYRGPGDYYCDILFLHFDMHKNTVIEGKILVDDVLPWQDREEEIRRRLRKEKRKFDFPLKIRKKRVFDSNSEMNSACAKLIYEINYKTAENACCYKVFSSFISEKNAEKAPKMYEFSTKNDEYVKISFD